MLVRRSTIVMLDSREQLDFDLTLVAAGGNGLRSTLQWFALAPPRDEEIVLSADEVVVLGILSPTQWVDLDELARVHSPAVLQSLLDKQLVVAQHSIAALRDDALRDTHWRSQAAVQHYSSRWHGVDTEAIQRDLTDCNGDDLLAKLGPPPALVRERSAAHERIALPRADTSALDALLGTRVTCRNFDRTRAITREQFSSVLQRAWGARAVQDFAPAVPLLKKGVPSAGGLHATEAYLLVQHVEGVLPGLYHYHPVDHALEPIRDLSVEAAAALARRFVAAQTYFVDAHVMVIAVSRFRRNYWKYRNHAKAYRALILDVGHLSQTQYLAATELGLAAFITAAINEVDIEQALGLDAIEESPLAVTGFGIRATQRAEVEWDPLHVVWPR
jgi:putative peptide maturation dehydrogenase